MLKTDHSSSSSRRRRRGKSDITSNDSARRWMTQSRTLPGPVGRVAPLREPAGKAFGRRLQEETPGGRPWWSALVFFVVRLHRFLDLPGVARPAGLAHDYSSGRPYCGQGLACPAFRIARQFASPRRSTGLHSRLPLQCPIGPGSVSSVVWCGPESGPFSGCLVMASADDLIASCRVPEGKEFRLKDHEPDWAGDPGLPKEERKRARREIADAGRLRAGRGPGPALRGGFLVDPDDLPGDGRRRQGQHDQARHVGRQPPGLPGLQLQATLAPRSSTTTSSGGTRGPCPSGAGSASSTARITRKSWWSGSIPSCSRPSASPTSSWTRNSGRTAIEDINALERHLARNGTVVLKFFLHVSKDEQRKRFLKRLEDPRKHWKFSAADLVERGFWDDYMKAYEDAIGATSTKWAPWYIIPADHKWVTRGLVARISLHHRGARPPLPRGHAPSSKRRSSRPGSSSRRRR